ncbi:MAG: hypothetical protein ACE141_00885 [Bryobacteraceae bacterium]
MPQCLENQVVTAKAGEKIDFGWVDSCMTVTCNMVDGTRVAGHFVQYGDKEAVFATMSLAIGTRLIRSIRLVGQLRSWTPDLQEQPAIIEQATKNWTKAQKDEMQKMSMIEVDRKYGKYFEQFSIAGKPDAFKEYIYRKLGCPVSNMSLRAHESGLLSY